MLEAVGYDVGDAVHDLIDQQTKETGLHELRKKEKLSRLELEARRRRRRRRRRPDANAKSLHAEALTALASRS